MYLLESVVSWTVTQYFTLYFWRSISTSPQDFHISRWTFHSKLNYKAEYFVVLAIFIFIETPVTWYRAIYFSWISDEMYCQQVHDLHAIASQWHKQHREGKKVKIQGDLHQLAERQEDLQHTRRGHPTSIAILATVEIAKANNGGIVPYAAMSDIVNSMKPTLPWLTKGMLRNHISKLNKEKIQKDAARPPDEDVAATANSHSGGGSSTSTLSALTFDTTGGGNSATAAGTTGTTMGASTCNDEDDNAAGGRPKGSSDKSKRDVKKRQRLALLEATKQYQRALKKKRQEDGATTCLMHGTLATIIGKAKALCNVENFTPIHPSTILSRRKRNHINPVVLQGITSPMTAIEPYLIAIILQLARIRSPNNATSWQQDKYHCPYQERATTSR